MGEFRHVRERGGNEERAGRKPSPSRAPEFLLPLILSTPVTLAKSRLKDRTHGLTGELQIAEYNSYNFNRQSISAYQL